MKKRIFSLLLFLALIAGAALAAQPARRGPETGGGGFGEGYLADLLGEKLEEYRADGSLEGRIAFMEGLRSSKPEPALAASLSALGKNQGGYARTASGGIENFVTAMPATGEARLLVFLVEFPDCKNDDDGMTPDSVRESFFGEADGENDFYPYESLSAFYARSSYGKLNVGGDVLGWYTAREKRETYSDSGQWGIEGLVREVMAHYDESLDYSDYDGDGDGVIDGIYICFAGGDTGWGSSWWSYCSEWMDYDFEGRYREYEEDGAFTIDGKTIEKYVFLHSSRSDTGSFNRIAIHETGHMMGLPDYYDYSGAVSSHGGITRYDMMSGNEGDHNAFSKLMLGWIDEEDIKVFDLRGYDEARTLSLAPFAESGEVIILARDWDGNFCSEYFLLENYTNSGNNSRSLQAEGGGVRIWHVNALLTEDGRNFANDNSYSFDRLLYLLDASGQDRPAKGDECTHSVLYRDKSRLGINTYPSSNYYGLLFSGLELELAAGENGVFAASAHKTKTNTVPPELSAVTPGPGGSNPIERIAVSGCRMRITFETDVIVPKPSDVGLADETGRQIRLLGFEREGTRSVVCTVGDLGAAKSLVLTMGAGYAENCLGVPLEGGRRVEITMLEKTMEMSRMETVLGMGATAPVFESDGDMLIAAESISRGKDEGSDAAEIYKFDKNGIRTTLGWFNTGRVIYGWSDLYLESLGPGRLLFLRYINKGDKDGVAKNMEMIAVVLDTDTGGVLDEITIPISPDVAGTATYPTRDGAGGHVFFSYRDGGGGAELTAHTLRIGAEGISHSSEKIETELSEDPEFLFTLNTGMRLIASGGKIYLIAGSNYSDTEHSGGIAVYSGGKLEIAASFSDFEPGIEKGFLNVQGVEAWEDGLCVMGQVYPDSGQYLTETALWFLDKDFSLVKKTLIASGPGVSAEGIVHIGGDLFACVLSANTDDFSRDGHLFLFNGSGEMRYLHRFRGEEICTGVFYDKYSDALVVPWSQGYMEPLACHAAKNIASDYGMRLKIIEKTGEKAAEREFLLLSGEKTSIRVRDKDRCLALAEVSGAKYSLSGDMLLLESPSPGAVLELIYREAHAYGDWTAKEEPDGQSEGSAERACGVCGHTELVLLPALPVPEKIGGSSILLLAREGYEYRLGNGEWQASPEFSGLLPGRKYICSVRIAGDGPGLFSSVEFRTAGFFVWADEILRSASPWSYIALAAVFAVGAGTVGILFAVRAKKRRASAAVHPDGGE